MLPSEVASGTAPLAQARRLLCETGELPPGLVESGLARSWMRSLAAGLAPLADFSEATRLTDAQLGERLAAEADFLAHARPVMAHLFAQVRDSHSMVVLADRAGLLLETLGDADFLARAQRVALQPGATWHEAARGTNAIGTALVEGAPVVICGAEHFLERNAFLACTAAPICDARGVLLGALDISSDWRAHHPHTRALVRTAAHSIENRLFVSRHATDLCLHLHPEEKGIGTFVEGLVALSEDGVVIGANRAGLRMLGLTLADLGRQPLQDVLATPLGELLSRGLRHAGQSGSLRTVHGSTLCVQLQGGVRPRHGVPTASTPALPAALRPADALAGLDTGDARLAAAIGRARRVLDKPIPLLLQGESGVGKELFAQAIHASGPRRAGPFVALNCAALPEHLIEAELFGYAPGAFTGARKEGRAGRLREADGGTLFLDEIGDMPLLLQSRLLRVLQEREVTPLGGGRAVRVDFALICATHRRLRQEVEAGRFRADLYYRINGLALTLPALRERSDFAALAAQMLGELSPDAPLCLAPDLEAALAAHTWPGNLRQLANALRTAVALRAPGETEIGWAHLPDDLLEELRPATGLVTADAGRVTEVENRAGESLAQLSRAAIDRALVHAAGNVSAAARRLGISRSTLYRKLRSG